LADHLLQRPLCGFIGKVLRQSLFDGVQGKFPSSRHVPSLPVTSSNPSGQHSSDGNSNLWVFTFLPGNVSVSLEPFVLRLRMSQVQTLLEGLWKASNITKIMETKFPGLKQTFDYYDSEERQYLQTFITSLRISDVGQRIVFDPKDYSGFPCNAQCSQLAVVEISGLGSGAASSEHSGEIDPRQRLKRVNTRLKRVKCSPDSDAAINWLVKFESRMRVQKVPFRMAGFASPDGVMHVSHCNVTTTLMVQHEISSDVTREDGTKETIVTQHEMLLVVKQASTTEGLTRLKREAAVLTHLQPTERVAEIWKPEHLSIHLEKGILVCRYHPTPPGGAADIWKSLPEIAELLHELLQTIATLHDQGWIWLGLEARHILFNQNKLDPRNPTLPLRITGLEHAMQVDNNKAVLPSNLEISNALQFKAPECVPGETITGAVDVFAVGLLVKQLLHRNQAHLWEHRTDMAPDERAALLETFNGCVHCRSKRIPSVDAPLIDLIARMLQRDPESRPTASQALHEMEPWFSDLISGTGLVLGERSVNKVEGYLDAGTGQFIWPVELETTVVEDCRDRSRLTSYCRVLASLDTCLNACLAVYSGRPVSKSYLMWLKYYGLHTHSSNDGSFMGWDGRRQCNGIFDFEYYIQTRKVVHFFIYPNSPSLLIYPNSPNHNKNGYCVQVASLIDAPIAGNEANAHFQWLDHPMTPDAPGAPMFARTTVARAIGSITAHEPVLVSYGREYAESVFAELNKKSDVVVSAHTDCVKYFCRELLTCLSTEAS